MNPRLLIVLVASALGLLLLAVLFVALPPSDPVPAPHPSHGRFDTRFQPALNAIGSTRALPAVPLPRQDASGDTSVARHPVEGPRHERPDRSE